jgi:hypothetical protein
MQTQDIFDPPPPYQPHSDDIYLPDMDMNAWPSSYYGRTRRIDLAKFYHDILKASGNELTNHCEDQCSSSSSSDEEEQVITDQVSATSKQDNCMNKKSVTFSVDPPIVHEYESEYDNQPIHSYKDHSLFDDGWPGRTKSAMNSTGFMDFKSKIEAKLGAINDPSLVSQLDTCNENVDESSLLYNRGYRGKKSPSVKRLSLRPIPNCNMIEEPSLMMDSPSPSNSYTDSPLTTPSDTHAIPNLPTVDLDHSASSSTKPPNGGRWLKTLSRIRRSSIILKSK